MKYLLILLLMVAGVQVNAQRDLPESVIIEGGKLPICDSMLGILTVYDQATGRFIVDTAWRVWCAKTYERESIHGIVYYRPKWDNTYTYYWTTDNWRNVKYSFSKEVIDVFFQKLAFKPIKKKK